jgi:hypothetical protein
MSDKRINPTIDLVGYHLELIDDDQRGGIEKMLSPSELKSACQQLDYLLAPLNSDRIQVPNNLCSDLMGRIHQLHTTFKLPTTTRISPATDAPVPASGGFSLRELLSLAAAIAIFVGIVVPGYNAARLSANRTVCQDHLRNVGQGIASYADANGGQVPFIASLPLDGVWAPTSNAAPGYRYVSQNSRNLYPLVQQRFVNPQKFVCRDGDTPMSLNQAAHSDNFASPRNNSYSVYYVDQPLQQAAFQPNAPLVSDLTPLVDDNRQLISGPIPLNSTSHGSLNGQNVLRGDLGAIWTPTPNVGLSNDDIYRLIGVDKYTGHERPSTRTDSFLIP